MTVYVGFAVAHSMFPDVCEITKRVASFEEVKRIVDSGDYVSSVNKGHQSTIDVCRAKGLELTVPDFPPSVKLTSGDSFVVIGHNLPRLMDRREYTHDEMESAVFNFAVYTVK